MFVDGTGRHVSSSPHKVGAIPDAGQRVAHQQLAAGADWIKLYGSTDSCKYATEFQVFTYEELKAAAAVAPFAGKRIASHSYGPAGARAAVRAGTNTVEHDCGTFKFTMLWQQKDGQWRVARVVSYGH